MKLRLIAGIISAILLVVLVYFATPVQILGVVVVAAALAYLEFDKLFNESIQRLRQISQISMITLIAFTILSLSETLELGALFFWTGFLLISIVHVFRASQKESMQEAVYRVSVKLLGFIYIISLFGFLVPILKIPTHGRDYLILLFALVFCCDSAAYFAGKYFGKRPLASRISPKKTVEGAIAGSLITFAVTAIWLKWIFKGDVTVELTLQLMLLSPFIAGLAQLGDLFESILKRSQDKKDSGVFIPGHGGILDRIDGLVFSSPIFYVYLKKIVEDI